MGHCKPAKMEHVEGTGEDQFSWKSTRVRQFFLQCSLRKFCTQVPCLLHALGKPRLLEGQVCLVKICTFSFALENSRQRKQAYPYQNEDWISIL